MGKKGGKKGDQKGKKERKDKKSLEIWKRYSIQGNKLERKNKTCPKCGIDSSMANHKNRLFCGKCHYVEMRK